MRFTYFKKKTRQFLQYISYLHFAVTHVGNTCTYAKLHGIHVMYVFVVYIIHSFFSVNTIHVIWLDRSAGVFTCIALAKTGLVVGQLRPSVSLSVRPEHFRMPSLCNLLLQKFSFFFIQTLPNDCLHIEDVHLLFCASFIVFSSHYTPPLKCGEVLCYTLRCLSVCPSVRPSVRS